MSCLQTLWWVPRELAPGELWSWHRKCSALKAACLYLPCPPSRPNLQRGSGRWIYHLPSNASFGTDPPTVCTKECRVQGQKQTHITHSTTDLRILFLASTGHAGVCSVHTSGLQHWQTFHPNSVFCSEGLMLAAVSGDALQVAFQGAQWHPVVWCAKPVGWHPSDSLPLVLETQSQSWVYGSVSH